MISRTYSNSTTTVSTGGCTSGNGNCTDCTMDCTIIVIDTTPTRDPWAELLESLPTYLPDKEVHYILPEPIDMETIRFWRKAQKKSRYRDIIEHKPLIKRRMPLSKSGWLARKGRLRKKGKK